MLPSRLSFCPFTPAAKPGFPVDVGRNSFDAKSRVGDISVDTTCGKSQSAQQVDPGKHDQLCPFLECACALLGISWADRSGWLTG